MALSVSWKASVSEIVCMDYSAFDGYYFLNLLIYKLSDQITNGTMMWDEMLSLSLPQNVVYEVSM